MFAHTHAAGPSSSSPARPGPSLTHQEDQIRAQVQLGVESVSVGVTRVRPLKPVPIPVVIADAGASTLSPLSPPNVRVGSHARAQITARPVVQPPSAPQSAPAPPKPSCVPAQTFYPTPPPSPDLIDLAIGEAESVSQGYRAQPQSLQQPLQSQVPDETAYAPAPPSPVRYPHAPLPITFHLSTAHDLPHVGLLRLSAPEGILAALGRYRVLSLDATVWDRMPYSAATATTTAMTRDAADEEIVESLLGEETPRQKGPALKMPKYVCPAKSTDPGSSLDQVDPLRGEHMSSIFVQPPTPERDTLPNPLSPAAGPSEPLKSTSTPTPNGRASSPRPSPQDSPRVDPDTSLPSLKALPVPIQVLHEVRSPPRKSIAMAADSLQLTGRRGRRPRLFGFTELPESGSSSANSSANNSRNNSPERQAAVDAQPSPLSMSMVASSSSAAFSTVPGPSTVPRRQPVRAKSEESLPTLASSASRSPAHLPQRRRENGLKLDFTGIVPVASPSGAQTAHVPSPYSSSLIRKKSGEILKPALKYSGPLSRSGTPIDEPESNRPRFESKSCPTTPSCPKYVHFDAKLERVKLFLHDQKPTVVSRSGSPTYEYTTSEGEEFPFPPTDEEKDDAKVLQIRLPNFPTSHPPDADLYLESIFLDDDRRTLKGIVMCRNIAFQKWVAVRFTLDWWQTTSEVSASHKDSVKGGGYDRFAFVIKLHDLMSKIEEKTLFLAIRYNTDGREIWDSNAGQNYQVTFEKVAPAPSKASPARQGASSIQAGMGKAVGGRTSQWSVNGSEEDRMADLKARLNRLSADDPNTSPPQLSPNRAGDRAFAFSPRRSFSSPQGSPNRAPLSLESGRSDLPSAGPSLAARYDFGAAFKGAKETRREGGSSPQGRHAEISPVRTGLLQFGGRTPSGHAATEFYSPRAAESLHNIDPFFAPVTTKSPSPISDFPVTVPNVIVPSPSSSHFSSTVLTASSVQSPVPDLHVQGPSPEPTPEDEGPAAPVACARPASPARPGYNRSRTSPAIMRKQLSQTDPSQTSPPQLDPPSSATDTPSDSPKSPPDVGLLKWSPADASGGGAKGKGKGDALSLASYSSFIEQFCWGGAAASPSIGEVRRSHSASSLDQYFSNATSGGATPRPALALSPTPSGGSDGSVGSHGSHASSSYFTAYGGATPRREREAELHEVDMVVARRGGGLQSTPERMGGGMGSMSPPVVC